MASIFSYPKAAMERAMKVQEVILRAMAKKASGRDHWISDRHMRRWRDRYEEFGYRGLFDGRRGKPSPKRVPPAGLERVLERRRGTDIFKALALGATAVGIGRPEAWGLAAFGQPAMLRRELKAIMQQDGTI